MDEDGSQNAEPPSPGPDRDHGRAHPLKVEIADDERLLGGDRCAWIASRAEAALGTLGASGEVRARVVGDAAMSEAHWRWAGVPGTTDVLTFDLRDGAEGPLDVDLLVCADEAARQGAARGHEAERELLLYVIHGVLHCLGHDDHDETSAARMHAEEDRLLAGAGVGPVYSRSQRELQS